ncbi:MAG TPA: fumarylacetoacetate hydrolase family protein [Blastocatellia bacterium]|jgi:acylpyruvate hydrolase|nr:fumarylacetoacetate hydrolase family protein [Blastocatellia bacterium]
MKLLSMRVENQNLAGIVIGGEALEASGFLNSQDGKAAIIQTPAGPATRDYAADPLKDALDLYLLGEANLRAITSQINGDAGLADKCRAAGLLRPLSEIRLNHPVVAPGKILAVGLNYAAHAAEQNAKPPETPLIFSKNVTALIGHGDSIRLPRISDRIDYEAELALVIGKRARSVSADRALDHVAGYTIMNDVTARDLQSRERQWARAKGLDTFAPCGPWLVTKDEIPDPHSLEIALRVNGEIRQRSNTNDLIFKVPQIIEFVSQDLTLMPGDIISTGTPSGVGIYRQPPVFLKAGDEIEIEVERIGTLRNVVAGIGG